MFRFSLPVVRAFSSRKTFSQAHFMTNGIQRLNKPFNTIVFRIATRFLTTESLPKVIVDRSVSNKGSSKVADDDWLTMERELYQLRKQMLNFYQQGKYESALTAAIDFQDLVEKFATKNSTLYASAVNNIALMQKNLGNFDAAMNKYIEALQIYRNIHDMNNKQSNEANDIKNENNENTSTDNQGYKNASYASTLCNLGLLYKEMATQSKGMEKLQLEERSLEALTDSYQIRVKIFSTKHIESIQSHIHLASLYRYQNKLHDAEGILLENLQLAQELTKEKNCDLLIATILNNLGLLKKTSKEYQHALKYYQEALEIRKGILGEKHNDTIVSMHNIAECHIAAGQDKEANVIQEEILKTIGTNVKNSSNNGSDTGHNEKDITMKSVDNDKQPVEQSAQLQEVLQTTEEKFNAKNIVKNSVINIDSAASFAQNPRHHKKTTSSSAMKPATRKK